MTSYTSESLENSEISNDERSLPWPGGIKEQGEQVFSSKAIKQDIFKNRHNQIL